MTEPSEKFWESVYNRNIGKMIGICYRYTADRQLSEDLAHDAFLKAIDKAAGFEGRGSFDAWLRRIVVNHVLQHIRDQKNKKHVGNWLQHEGHVQQPEDNGLGQDLSEQAGFSAEELLDAIGNLPEHHRLVFNLYVIDQFTHVQIGEELGISSGTSKSHLARARKKIKELLAQKASRKRDEKDLKRRWLPLLFLYTPLGIDRIYRKQLDAFGIAPGKSLSAGLKGISAAPKIIPRTITSWTHIMAATSTGIILVVSIVVFNAYQRKEAPVTELTRSAIHNEEHRGILQKSANGLKENETIGRKNDSSVGSDTATFFPDSVILNKKTKSMKKLDSIGVMLLVSSSVIFDSAAQSNKDVLLVDSKSQAIATTNAQRADSLKADGSLQTKAQKSKTKEGTFFASRLFWSGTNNELYFKGKVIANMNDQNFIANGSVNFLGPVYLLIIDDKPATLNSTIELSDKQYRLTRLSSREATEKYGENGRQGAIEISLVE